MKGKKVIHWGAWGNGGTIQIASWKCNFGIYLDVQLYYLDIHVYYLDIQVYYLDIQVYYLDIQVYYLDIQAITTLLCLLLVLYVLVLSIYSIFYLTTALLKSDIFWLSKASSSHSFQPTGIGLGSL